MRSRAGSPARGRRDEPWARVPDLADRLLSPEPVNAVADAMPTRYRALVLAATFRRALENAGVPPVRFHDLRHVAQVFAAEAGATLPKLMARLGHASPAAAMIYLHARPERDQALTDALSAAMAGLQ